MSKILFLSPYLETLGGGERYFLSIAQALSENNQIDILGNRFEISQARNMFGLPLKNIDIKNYSEFSALNLFKRNQFLRNYQELFYMTDGSLFFTPLKKSFLVIQSPAHIPAVNFINNRKLKNWKIICYSAFMQKIIKERLGRLAAILSPYIEQGKTPAAENGKQNIFLSVGRFFSSHLHEKRQDLLISFFKKNYIKHFQDWQLVLAGNAAEESGKLLVKNLKHQSEGFPIQIRTDISYKDLMLLYGSAKIYWHAAGFGSDPVKHPEKMEHFGITTLEAMANRCVPIVFGQGGQRDIIEDGKNGLFWHDEKSFLEANLKILSDEIFRKTLSRSAEKRAADFSRSVFEKKLNEIFKK